MQVRVHAIQGKSQRQRPQRQTYPARGETAPPAAAAELEKKAQYRTKIHARTACTQGDRPVAEMKDRRSIRWQTA